MTKSNLTKSNLTKSNIKYVLLAIQGSGEADEWQNDNFVLYNIAGLRNSTIQRNETNYAQ